MYKPIFKWIPGSTNIVADAIYRKSDLEPTESASHLSLASLLRQLTAQQEPVPEEEALLHFMKDQPSILEQCKRLYPSDEIFGPVFPYLQRSDSSNLSTPVDLNKSIRANLSHFYLEDGYPVFPAPLRCNSTYLCAS